MLKKDSTKTYNDMRPTMSMPSPSTISRMQTKEAANGHGWSQMALDELT